MDNYKVEETENTPLVDLNATDHTLKFEGDSRPEDVQKFFHPILDWLDEYEELLKSVGAPTTITCDFVLEYFNSSSAKYIMDIVNQLGNFNRDIDNVELKVNWHYEEMDEDMLEAGEEFQDMLQMSFNFIKLDD